MKRTLPLLIFCAAGVVAVASLQAQPPIGPATTPANQARQQNAPIINGAADKAATRQKAKQKAASAPRTSTSISFEKPLSFPNDI